MNRNMKVFSFFLAVIFLAATGFLLNTISDKSLNETHSRSTWIKVSGPNTCCIKQVETIIKDNPGVLTVELKSDLYSRARGYDSKPKGTDDKDNFSIEYLYQLKTTEAFRLADIQKAVHRAGEEHDKRLGLEGRPEWKVFKVRDPADNMQEPTTADSVGLRPMIEVENIPLGCCPVNRN